MAPPTPIIYKKFECAGDGLTVSGHRRVSPDDLKSALGLIQDGSTEKHPKSWWEAQVRLYGLKCNRWTIDGMKKVLLDAVNSTIEVPAEINALEERLNNEYVASLNFENHDTDHDDTSDMEGDTEYDPMKLTREILRLTSFGANTTPEDRAKMASEFKDNMNKTADALRDRQLTKMNRQHALLLASSEGAGNDVFGTWQLDCPEIIKQWGHLEMYAKGNIIWVIHPPLTHESHLWCSFKQIVVEGVLCIDWKSAIERHNWRGRKNKFTFRGITPGDGDFCCDDEWNKGWIVFTSEHECHGEFETQFGEKPWIFTGVKISSKRNGKQQHSLSDEYKRLERDWLKKVMF
jgi:hypothetical protein